MKNLLNAEFLLDGPNETWWNATVCSSAAGNSTVSWVMQFSFLLQPWPSARVQRRRWCCSVKAHPVSFHRWATSPSDQHHLWTIRELFRAASSHLWPWQCPQAQTQICAEMSTSKSKQICAGPLTSPWFGTRWWRRRVLDCAGVAFSPCTEENCWITLPAEGAGVFLAAALTEGTSFTGRSTAQQPKDTTHPQRVMIINHFD